MMPGSLDPTGPGEVGKPGRDQLLPHGKSGTPGAALPAVPATEAPGGTGCPRPDRSSILRTPPSPLRSCKPRARASAAGEDAGGGDAARGDTASPRPAGPRRPSGPARVLPPPAIASAPRPVPPLALFTNRRPPHSAPSANHAPKSDLVPTRCLTATRWLLSGGHASTQQLANG